MANLYLALTMKHVKLCIQHLTVIKKSLIIFSIFVVGIFKLFYFCHLTFKISICVIASSKINFW